MKKVVTYSAGLIALYLVVNGLGTGTVLSSGAKGIASVVKTFQGRG